MRITHSNNLLAPRGGQNTEPGIVVGYVYDVIGVIDHEVRCHCIHHGCDKGRKRRRLACGGGDGGGEGMCGRGQR